MSKNSLVASEESKQTYAWVTELQNEIEQLKAERDAALARVDASENVIKFIYVECDWEEYNPFDQCSGKGDNRIGEACKKALAPTTEATESEETPCQKFGIVAIDRSAWHTSWPTVTIRFGLNDLDSRDAFAEMLTGGK